MWDKFSLSIEGVLIPGVGARSKLSITIVSTITSGSRFAWLGRKLMIWGEKSGLRDIMSFLPNGGK